MLSSVVTHRTDERQHVAGDVSSSEPLPGIGEKVLPLALEDCIFRRISQSGVPLRDDVLFKIGFQSSTPGP